MEIEAQVALAERTTMGVGGYAAHYARAESEADLLEALAWATQQKVEVRVLGGGSNIVVADAGFAGLVIEMAMRGTQITERDGAAYVQAAAGEPWDDFVASMVARGYQGVECLSGIPGRVGATPIQNVGAYGQDVSETITRVHAWDRQTNAACSFDAAECQFAYRDSFFKAHSAGRYIVTAVTFRLRPNVPPAIRYAELQRHFAGQHRSAPSLAEARETVIQLRRSKSMLLDVSDPNSRSCGSFFLNPVLSAPELHELERRATGEGDVPQFAQADGRTKLSAGWLIEHAGFARGTREGPVGLSTKHALALVAFPGARAADVLRFAARVQRGVAERFGVALEPEPVIWGAHG